MPEQSPIYFLRGTLAVQQCKTSSKTRFVNALFAAACIDHLPGVLDELEQLRGILASLTECDVDTDVSIESRVSGRYVVYFGQEEINCYADAEKVRAYPSMSAALEFLRTDEGKALVARAREKGAEK